MSPERERCLSGEWDEETTGPIRPTVCPSHQGQVVAVALLKEKLDNVKEDVCTVTRSVQTLARTVEELRIATARDRVRLTMLLSVAATIGGGVASFVFKAIGG